MKKTGLKLFILNASLSLINIILFAKPFLHIRIGGGSALLTAFGVMTIVMSVIVFFYGNTKILLKKPEAEIPLIKDSDIKTLDDCTIAVNNYIRNNIETFAKSLNTVLSQINRMKKKKKTVRDTLLERFSETELSYGKFTGAVEGIENIMILNIKSLLNRMNAFDEEDYEKLIKEHSAAGGSTTSGGFIGQGDRITQSKLDIYREYMDFVERAVENNEEMLIRLDKLLLEISKLNSLSQEEIENMHAMKEIDSLIKDTKWYR